jgi:hypothetical protein
LRRVAQKEASVETMAAPDYSVATAVAAWASKQGKATEGVASPGNRVRRDTEIGIPGGVARSTNRLKHHLHTAVHRGTADDHAARAHNEQGGGQQRDQARDAETSTAPPSSPSPSPPDLTLLPQKGCGTRMHGATPPPPRTGATPFSPCSPGLPHEKDTRRRVRREKEECMREQQENAARRSTRPRTSSRSSQSFTRNYRQPVVPKA